MFEPRPLPVPAGSQLPIDAERTTLALTEAGTRLADRRDPVPNEVFAEAAKHDDQRALAALVVHIAAISTWNRLNVINGQVGGGWAAQCVSWVAGASP